MEKPSKLPIDEDMVARLGESCGDEELAILLHILAFELAPKERWLAAAFKQPKELLRWGASGYAEFGLDPLLAPLRSLARRQAAQSLSMQWRGHVNDCLRPRFSHALLPLALAPGFDWFYWGLVAGVFGFAAWGGHWAAQYAYQGSGEMAMASIYLLCSASLAALLKGAIYIWQDSSSNLGEAIQRWVWGRNPKQKALERLVSSGFPQSPSSIMARPTSFGRKKPLTALAAYELAVGSREAKSGLSDWRQVEEAALAWRRSDIERSKQPGFALACIEKEALSSGAEPQRAKSQPSRRL